MARRRLDMELVRRHLAPSREQARQLVAERRVLVNGAVADKPARLVAAADALLVQGPPPPFVGRGGQKLAAALREFDLRPSGWRVIDAGASTGGFTDCVLQSGAAEVVAIDVGRGQLHQRLRSDHRVHSLERTNIRSVEPDEIGGPAPLVVADLSFISLRTVMEALVNLTEPDGHLVVLVKPQFEAGRQEAARSRGVIADPAVWRRVLGEVARAAAGAGAPAVGAIVSPLRGADGNVEFFLHLQRSTMTAGPTDELFDQLVASIVEPVAPSP